MRVTGLDNFQQEVEGEEFVTRDLRTNPMNWGENQRMGDGPRPTATDKVKVHYEGRLTDGTVFDSSSHQKDGVATFRADNLIKGWTEALTLMPVGSKWQLYIPYQLAYGERKTGKINPCSALIFDLELIGIDTPAEKSKGAADVGTKQGK